MEFLQRLRMSLNYSEVAADPCSILDLLKANLPMNFYEVPKEAKDLVNTLFKSCKAVCPHCNSAETSYRYLNNKKRCRFIQPRFLCSNCKRCFTVGGRKNISGHTAPNSTPTNRSCVFPNQFQPPAKKSNTQFGKRAEGITDFATTSCNQLVNPFCEYSCGYQPNETECQIPISSLSGRIGVHEEQSAAMASYNDGDHWAPRQTRRAHVEEATINNFNYVEEYQLVGEVFNDMSDYFDGAGIELALGNSTRKEGISDFVYNIIRKCDEYQASTGESELCSLFQPPLFTAD